MLLVKYNIDRDQKKPVSTVFIGENEITQKIRACSLSFRNIRYIAILAKRGSVENTASDRCPTVKSSNALTSTIKLKYHLLSLFVFL